MYRDYITVAGTRIPVTVVGKEEIANSNENGITVFKIWVEGHIRMFETHEHVVGKTGPETVYYLRIAGYNANRKPAIAAPTVAAATAPQKTGELVFIDTRERVKIAA